MQGGKKRRLIHIRLTLEAKLNLLAQLSSTPAPCRHFHGLRQSQPRGRGKGLTKAEPGRRPRPHVPLPQNTICLLAPRARSCQALSLCGHRRWPGGWSGEKGGPIHHCQPGARAAPRRRGTGRTGQLCRVRGLLFENLQRRLANPDLRPRGIRTFAFTGFCS